MNNLEESFASEKLQGNTCSCISFIYEKRDVDTLTRQRPYIKNVKSK